MIWEDSATVYNKIAISDGMGGSELVVGIKKPISCKFVNATFQKVVTGNRIEHINESKIMTNVLLETGMFVSINGLEFKIKNCKSVKAIRIYDLEEVK